MENEILDKTQRITSYVCAYGLYVYEIEQYNLESNEWYPVGDSSTDKNLIITMIECNNSRLYIDRKGY